MSAISFCETMDRQPVLITLAKMRPRDCQALSALRQKLQRGTTFSKTSGHLIICTPLFILTRSICYNTIPIV